MGKSNAGTREREEVIEGVHRLFFTLSKFDPKGIPKEQISDLIVTFAQINDFLFLNKQSDVATSFEAYSYYLYGLSVEAYRQMIKTENKLDYSFPTFKDRFRSSPRGGGIEGDQNLLEPFQRELRAKALAFLKGDDEKVYGENSVFIFDKCIPEKDKSAQQGELVIPIDLNYLPSANEVNQRVRGLEDSTKKKLFAKYPELEMADHRKCLMTALCDLTGTILSPAEASLRRQAFICCLTAKKYQPISSKGNLSDWELKENKDGKLQYHIKNIKYGGTTNDFGDLTDKDLLTLVSSVRKREYLEGRDMGGEEFLNESYIENEFPILNSLTLKGKDEFNTRLYEIGEKKVFPKKRLKRFSA